MVDDVPYCANGHDGIPMRYSHIVGGVTGGMIYVCPQCGRKVHEYRDSLRGHLIVQEIWKGKRR